MFGELQGPIAIYTDGLGYFWMTGTRTVLDCLDTGIFTAEMCAIQFAAIFSNLNR
jgi:hypothetical protein